MRGHAKQNRFYCGIDFHARSLRLCLFDPNGNFARSVEDNYL